VKHPHTTFPLFASHQTGQGRPEPATDTPGRLRPCAPRCTHSGGRPQRPRCARQTAFHWKPRHSAYAQRIGEQ